MKNFLVGFGVGIGLIAFLTGILFIWIYSIQFLAAYFGIELGYAMLLVSAILTGVFFGVINYLN